jgi:gas vesicle protein
MAKANNIITGIIAGAVVGTVVGLLFAPKTGKETRDIVSTRAGIIRQRAGDYVGNIREKIRRGKDIEDAEEASNNHVDVAGV